MFVTAVVAAATWHFSSTTLTSRYSYKRESFNVVIYLQVNYEWNAFSVHDDE
jgi:hypothetical protein